jgi:hypothetical protein
MGVAYSADRGPCSLHINELKIENSTKIKARKVYLPKLHQGKCKKGLFAKKRK